MNNIASNILASISAGDIRSSRSLSLNESVSSPVFHQISEETSQKYLLKVGEQLETGRRRGLIGS